MNESLKVIITAETKKLRDELNKGKKQVESFGSKAGKALKQFNKDAMEAGKACQKGMAMVGVALAGAIASLVGITKATEEYRRNQALLNTAFQTNGGTVAEATKTYNELYRVLGDGGQATEAAQHLAKLTTEEKALSEWTNICQGVYATFGASLPIESLTEAANETAKTGTLTGGLADALNWAGINEEAFQAKLDACNTEAEREALIRSTLNGLYSEAATNYETNNAALLAQNEANAKNEAALARVGAALQPVLTAFTNFSTLILEQLAPIIEDFAANHMDELEDILTKVGEAIGTVITWIVDNWDWLVQIAAVIAGITAAWAAYHAVMTIVNAVSAIFAMNPIVLIISAIIAVLIIVAMNWDKVKEVALNCWNGIKNAFSAVGKFFMDIFGTAYRGIVNAFSSIGSFFSGVWENIKSIFSSVGTAIGDAIKGAVSWAVNGVLSTAVGIINGFISAINFAIDIINAIPGVSIKRLSKLEVPQMAKGGIVDSATLAVVGEQGKEAVVPLENNLEWLDKLAGMLNDRMGGNKPIVLEVDGKVFAQTSIDSINALTRQTGNLGLVVM